MYHLQFSLQAASPETFGYTLVCWDDYELYTMCNEAVVAYFKRLPGAGKKRRSPSFRMAGLLAEIVARDLTNT
jgi:hypothetical protein